MRAVVIGNEVIEPPQKEDCGDKKCPFHGDVTVRGQLIVGRVVSDKMQRTVVVAREGARYVKKYKRYMRTTYKIHAHNPPCVNAHVGDIVLLGETRKLAKTVNFVVLKVIKKAKEGEQ